MGKKARGLNGPKIWVDLEGFTRHGVARVDLLALAEDAAATRMSRPLNRCGANSEDWHKN